MPAGTSYKPVVEYDHVVITHLVVCRAGFRRVICRSHNVGMQLWLVFHQTIVQFSARRINTTPTMLKNSLVTTTRSQG